MRRQSHIKQTQRGVTLIELIIAISLVAAISAGMLSAFRMGLTTLERTQQRLEDNRTAVSKLDTIRRHIGGAMPVNALCQGSLPQPLTSFIFRGDAANLLLATNESLTEGSRGYPRIALYRILPNPDGTLRLTVEEHWFSGPFSTIPFCDTGGLIRPSTIAPPESTVVLFERLGAARFEYRQLSLGTHMGLLWQDKWISFNLPYAVRLYLEAPPGPAPRMPLGAITIPFHITKEPGAEYDSTP